MKNEEAQHGPTNQSMIEDSASTTMDFTTVLQAVKADYEKRWRDVQWTSQESIGPHLIPALTNVLNSFVKDVTEWMQKIPTQPEVKMEPEGFLLIHTITGSDRSKCYTLSRLLPLSDLKGYGKELMEGKTFVLKKVRGSDNEPGSETKALLVWLLQQNTIPVPVNDDTLLYDNSYKVEKTLMVRIFD